MQDNRNSAVFANDKLRTRWANICRRLLTSYGDKSLWLLREGKRMERGKATGPTEPSVGVVHAQNRQQQQNKGLTRHMSQSFRFCTRACVCELPERYCQAGFGWIARYGRRQPTVSIRISKVPNCLGQTVGVAPLRFFTRGAFRDPPTDFI
jgi:hypothetical protein